MKKTIKKAVTALATAIVVGASALSAPAASAQGQVINIPLPQGSSVRDFIGITGIGKNTVNQGATIYGEDGPNRVNQCTLGYISPGNTYGYAAAHCFTQREGSVVYDAQYRPIGRVSNIYTGGGRDFARISFNDNVFGANVFTGDKTLSWRDARVGDPICFYGKASVVPKCSRVINVSPFKVTASTHSAVRGDSGGPAWIPGKGWIGVVSAAQIMFVGNVPVRHETVIETVR